MESSDGSVVRRVLDGNPDSYRILVERYRAKFGDYATALVGDSDMAADAMQEAFIRAYDSLARCRDPDRFGSWFFRILTNQCHEARDRRRPTVDIRAVDPPDRMRSDADLERHELAGAIDGALADLTPEQREAFVMKHVDGRSYEEMADITGVAMDALKMRVHRARDSLRAMLGGLR